MDAQTPPPPFLSARQAAVRLERSPRTIYNLIADGELPAVKIRGLIRVPSAALEQWIDDKSGEALNAVRQRDDGP